MSEHLYAWADVTRIGVGEHTWVTTYTPGSGTPDPRKGAYWYCWGVPHNKSHPIGVGEGGIAFAQMIGKSHDPKDNVGLIYGEEGVCHQMANRLLRFALGEDDQPITVKGARGYQLSVGMYGEYGGKTIFLKSNCIKKWEKTVLEHLRQNGGKK